MRYALWILASLVALIGVVALIGYFLPVAHEASRSAEVNRPPEVVFALMADVSHYKLWWNGADVKSEVVESVPPSRIVTRIVGETQFGGTWTIEIAPTSGGSLVTITERGEVYNVIFRTLSKLVFGHTSTMNDCLVAVKRKLS